MQFILKNPDFLTDLIFDNSSEPRPARLPAVLNSNDQIPATDTDKAWQALLILLDGISDVDTPVPYNAILGLNEVSPVTLSVGPAHYLTVSQVNKLAISLSGITRDKLFENYNPEAMEAEVGYPNMWSEDDSETDKEYIWQYFQEMIRYFNDAAGRGNAIITYLL